MKNTLLLFLLFISFNSFSQTIHLSTDSLYRVVMDDRALMDPGIGHNNQTPIIEEVFSISEPNSPTTELVNKLSHAQLWSIIEESEGRFVFKNYKTGRVIYTDKILPPDGVSWNEAKETEQWEHLPLGVEEGKLYMGPNPKDISLTDKISYFICDASDKVNDSDKGYLYPNRDEQSSFVFISYQDPILDKWTIMPCYKIGDPNIPKDPSSSGITEVDKVKPFVQTEVGLDISEPCNIYTVGGIARRNITGSIALQTGVYIVQCSITGGTWKVAIP